MNGLYIIILFCTLCIGLCVWLWGCTGNVPKPDDEIERAKKEAFIERSLR